MRKGWNVSSAMWNQRVFDKSSTGSHNHITGWIIKSWWPNMTHKLSVMHNGL